jgi:hypothetical protein
MPNSWFSVIHEYPLDFVFNISHFFKNMQLVIYSSRNTDTRLWFIAFRWYPSTGLGLDKWSLIIFLIFSNGPLLLMYSSITLYNTYLPSINKWKHPSQWRSPYRVDHLGLSFESSPFYSYVYLCPLPRFCCVPAIHWQQDLFKFNLIKFRTINLLSMS